MKRESRKARRKRVIRNRIMAVAVLLAIAAVAVVVIIALGNNKKEVDVPSGGETVASTDETTTVQTESDETTSEETTQSAANPDDVTAPTIVGSSNIFVSVGDTISYRSYVFVKDDYDPEPELSVNNQGVDLGTPGEYTVTYTATDASGNSSSKDLTLTVQDAVGTAVSVSTIYSLADSVLANIIRDDMTDLQKVFAVFYYVRENVVYVPGTEKHEYKQEAYKVLTTMRDTCYGNNTLMQLLLEKLGYKVFLCNGILSYSGEIHFWLWVSIDDGNTWYMADPSTWPYQYTEIPICMLTDSVVAEVSARHEGVYNYDNATYPATPTESLWTTDTLAQLGLTMSNFGY